MIVTEISLLIDLGEAGEAFGLATARELRVPLLSMDERLRRYAAASCDGEVIW